MKRFFLVCIWLWSTAAYAGSAEILLAPPAEPFEAGSRVSLPVYVHNHGNQAVSIAIPHRVTCRIDAGGETVAVKAEAENVGATGNRTLQPGRFFRIRYVMIIPDRINGPVHLRIAEFDSPPLMTDVRKKDVHFAEAPAPPVEPAAAPPSAADFESLYQPYLANISSYRPTYFLLGLQPEDSKFQVSFKYRFFDGKGLPVQKIPWIHGFHFGYTQTSFWDLESESKPFEDTSYKPEIFHLTDNIIGSANGNMGFFVQTGFQHESNGQGGAASRSTNFLYVNPRFVFYDKGSKLGIQISPKVWTYAFNDDDTNPDLDDYRGYFDLGIKLGRADGWVLGSNFRWADQGASVILDWTYPLHRFFENSLNLYLQVQYVNALAESLLNFRQRNKALRVGFAIVR